MAPHSDSIIYILFTPFIFPSVAVWWNSPKALFCDSFLTYLKFKENFIYFSFSLSSFCINALKKMLFSSFSFISLRLVIPVFSSLILDPARIQALPLSERKDTTDSKAYMHRQSPKTLIDLTNGHYKVSSRHFIFASAVSVHVLHPDTQHINLIRDFKVKMFPYWIEIVYYGKTFHLLFASRAGKWDPITSAHRRHFRKRV